MVFAETLGISVKKFPSLRNTPSRQAKAGDSALSQGIPGVEAAQPSLQLLSWAIFPSAVFRMEKRIVGFCMRASQERLLAGPPG